MYNAQNISWIGDYTVSNGSSALKVSLPSNDIISAFQGAGNTNPDLYPRTLGKKKYEINDHLGNVRSVVSDIKLSTLSSTYVLEEFHPDILAACNYYAFGMVMPGRTYSSNSYRYGFQGQEKDDEVKGSGNSINYKYRMHDPRLGRFLSLDPLSSSYPHNSPYAFSENRVIDGVELEGLEVKNYLEDFLTELGTAAIKKVTAAAIELAIKYTKAVVEDYVDHTEVTLIASVSIDFKIGGGIAGQLDKVGGGEIDFSSVRLANFKGTIDLVEGKVDGEFYYFGKDDEFIISQKVSGSVPVVPGVGVGGGSSREEKKNFETKESTVTEQINSGVGIGILNLTLTGRESYKKWTA